MFTKVNRREKRKVACQPKLRRAMSRVGSGSSRPISEATPSGRKKSTQLSAMAASMYHRPMLKRSAPTSGVVADADAIDQTMKSR
jgi:hypothetical protein